MAEWVNDAVDRILEFKPERVLEIAPYHLDLSALDAEALDVTYSFEFLYAGNHDAAVSEAFLTGTAVESLIQVPGARVLNFEPAMMLALDENCRLQCRLGVETRTNAYHVRTGQFPDLPITVYCSVRQYWGKQPFKTFVESYQNQRRIAQEFVDTHVLPSVIRPLAQVISAK